MDKEQQRRHALDLWGFVRSPPHCVHLAPRDPQVVMWWQVAKDILQLTDRSTEEQMKAAFEILAAGHDDDEDEDEDDEDDDGQIDLKELRAFRDDDRKLHGKGVPEFIHKTDERFAGLTDEQKSHPDTIRRGGYHGGTFL